MPPPAEGKDDCPCSVCIGEEEPWHPEPKNKYQKVGVFLAPQKLAVKTPR
jgi:hypothetical protein